MIGPVSTTGRAMMASLQQAMAKGMPPEQAIQYVKSMATQGVAPLADLYSMMTQFQRLKEQKVNPPQTPPTIKDELNMMDQQQQMQQMQAEQMRQMQMQQARPPMEQGLGGMDAGSMERAQYAGGGIVAFQTGGMPQTNFDFTDPKNQLSYLRGEYGLGGSEESYIDKEMAEEEEIAKKYGLGQYGEAYKARQARISQLEGESAARGEEDRRMDRAEFFFNIAAAAAKPGATFFSSVAEAGPGYAKAARATNEKMRLLQDKAREAQIQLMEADELRKAGNIKEARKAREKAISDSIEIGNKIYTAKTQLDVARTYTAPRGLDATRDRILRELKDMETKGQTDTPEYKRKLALYQSSFPQVAAQQARSINQAPKFLQDKYKAALALVKETAALSDTDPTKIQALKDKQELETFLVQANYLPDELGATSSPTASGPLGAGSANDPLGIRVTR